MGQRFFGFFFFLFFPGLYWALTQQGVEKQNISSATIFFSILPTLKRIIKFARKPLRSSLSTFKFGALLLEYIHNRTWIFRDSFQ